MLIAITSNYGDETATLAEGYYRSISLAGATPIIISPTESDAEMLDIISHVGGIIFSGGGDINPLLVGEEPLPQLHSINDVRDDFELRLAQLADQHQVPMLGICRGIQVIAAALGGKIAQDIDACIEGKHLKHMQDAKRHIATHTVHALNGSHIYRALGGRFAVNSFHHQSVSSVAETSLRVTATSPDGIIEAVESNDGRQVIGVQWHPECFCLTPPGPATFGRGHMLPLFQHFVRECHAFSRARQWHRTHLTLDSHCDTPMCFDQCIDFCHGDKRILVDLPRMKAGHLDASIMVAYIPQPVAEQEKAAATRMADSILGQLDALIDDTPGVEKAETPDDLVQNKAEGVKSIMRGIENAAALGGDLANVERYARQGIVYMTLCHNGHNDVCDSARPLDGQPQVMHGGLSDFGLKVVREMNRVGVMVDLSHAAESSFYDAISASRYPIVCSHSSARALCNHPRNLTDDQLRALAESGGVAQVTLYHGFLRDDEDTYGAATIDDAVNHLMHMIDVAGIAHVGIGTDFDGDGGVKGLAHAGQVMHLTRRLMAEGLNDQELEMVWGKNFLRVMRQVQAARIG